MGLPPPDPRSLCPLSSTEFVEPPPSPNKIPGYATAHNLNIFQNIIVTRTAARLITTPFIYELLVMQNP